MLSGIAVGRIGADKTIVYSEHDSSNTDGTETVTLYGAASGGTTLKIPTGATTAFKAYTETVTNVFAADSVNSGKTQDVVGNQKEIWPQVIEKAYATAVGGYGSIQNGGRSTQAMEILTGQTATSYSPSTAASFAWFTAAVKADDMITMDTASGGTYGLFGYHCYMFTSVTGTSTANAMVHLANPWGFDQPAAIPLTQLSHAICEVNICHA